MIQIDNYLRFWGVRGSYATPYATHLKVGGNTSCVELCVNDQIIICDAGTGIIPLGQQLMQQDKIQELTILLTHYHWDHICGLPFFAPAFSPQWKLNFFGPGKSQAQIEESISDQMQAPYFPVQTEVWLADINYLKHPLPLQEGNIKIDTFNVHHPGSTFGYHMTANDKNIVYVSDNELNFSCQAIDKLIAESDAEEQSLLQQMKQETILKSIHFMKDIDILIHDSQYTPEDYRKKRGWGHSCYLDTVNSAIDANVKQLYLFHHDPGYNDDKVVEIHHQALALIQQRGSNLQCHIAKEETKIPI